MSQIHEVRLKDGTKRYGFISKVDYPNDTFYLMEQNQVGMLGRDGTPIPWADCLSVCADPGHRGTYDGPNRIEAWKEFRVLKARGGDD